MKINSILLTMAMLAFAVTGCTGFNTFGTAARAGDTVALTLGWQLGLSRQTISGITITDAAGISTVYGPNDAAVRSIFNSYPDPASNLLVKAETGPKSINSTLIEGNITGGDKEYAETIMVLDLPPAMATGTATIGVATTGGTVLGPLSVEILPGSGSPNTFANQEFFNVDSGDLKDLERAPHYNITFQGSTVPHAIEINLVHDPDANNGGSGYPHVINPRGDIKSTLWNDDGTRLKVLLIPARTATPTDFIHFKFYVAGGLTGLQLDPVLGISAYDVNGTAIPDVTATIN